MTDNKLPQGPDVPSAIATSVLSALHDKDFTGLSDHVLKTAVEENHVFVLIKTISVCYTKVMFHHLSKNKNDQAVGTIVRKQISKLILFKHQ